MSHGLFRWLRYLLCVCLLASFGVASVAFAGDVPPVANPDGYNTNENTPLTISASGVLGNDTPSNPGDGLQAVLVSSPSIGGALTLNLDGSFTYTPPSNFCGTDSFTYDAHDTSTNLDSSAATVTIQIICTADLEVTKTADQPTVNPGSSASFTITVQNNGPNQVPVTLTDPLPGGNNISWKVSSPQQNCNIKGLAPDQSLNCANSGPLQNLPPGQPFTIQVDGTVSQSYCNQSNLITNTASVSSSLVDPDQSNNSSTAAVQVKCPSNAHLAVTKTADNPSITAGDLAGYTIQVSNTGSSTANSVTLTDPLPGSGATNWTIDQPYSGPGTCTIDGTASQLTCSFGDLAAGAGASVHIASPTDYSGCPPQAPGYPLANTASVASTNTTGANGSAAITVTCPIPIATPDNYNTNENTSLLIPATGVLQNDTASNNDSLTAQLVSGPAGTLTLNSDGSFKYTPKSGFCATDSFTYQAVDATTKLVSSTATVTIQVLCTTDWQVTKTAVQSAVSPGSQASFKITVTNNGPNPDTVTLTDPLPGGNNISWKVSSPQQNCNIKGLAPDQSLNCANSGPLQNLPPGQPFTIQVDGTVSQSYCNQSNLITNTASVSSASGTPDPNPSNNSSTASIQVRCASPTLATQASPPSVTLVATGSPTLKDTATLSGGSSPTGTITFTLTDSANTALDTETVIVNGNGLYSTPAGYTLQTAGQVTGTYTWTATYSGDGGNTPASASLEPVTVSPATPTLLTSASPAQTTLGSGQRLNDSADLEGAYFPKGQIDFTLTDPNGTVVYQNSVTVSGNGTVVTQSGGNPGGYLPTLGGTYTWQAFFSGNANNNPVKAASEPVTVSSASTATTLTSSPNPTVFGQPVTFKALVSSAGGTPTGKVNFMEGNTTVGTASLDGTGTAAFATATLAVGAHTITASYVSSPSFNASSSPPLTQTVKQAATTTILSSSANPSIINQPVTFTAAVSVSAPGAGTPTGTVTFQDGTTTIGTGSLGAGGNPANVATFGTGALGVGSHSITAVYGGDSNFTGSSNTLSQAVRYNIRVLSTSVAKGAPTIVLQLWDFNFVQNLSTNHLKLTAACVVPFSSGAPPTTCTNAVQSSGVNAGGFNFVSDYNGQGPAYSYKVSTKGLTPGSQYYQLVQADGDPILQAIQFSD